MADKVPVNITIAEKHYILRVDKDEEEIVRKAGKLVNKKLSTYRNHFQRIDPESLMQMVALDISEEAIALEKRNDTAPFIERVKKLTNVLDEYLKEEK